MSRQDDQHGIVQRGTNNAIGAVSFGSGSATSSGAINQGLPPPAGGGAPGEPPAAPAPQPPRRLPPYRAVLVVDAAGFEDASSADQGRLSEGVGATLEAAFDHAGLAAEWRDRRFRPQSHTGRFVVGLRPEVLPQLLDPFLRVLQEELRRRDRERLHHEPQLRLGASIHVGPLPDVGAENDGVGTPMTDTHRLLQSEEVQRALAASSASVTYVAAIVSQRVFEDVVEAGYTDLHPSRFVPVQATAKRFSQRAYVHLPTPPQAFG